MTSYQTDCKNSLHARDVFMEQTQRVCQICLQPLRTDLELWNRRRSCSDDPTSLQQSDGTSWHPGTYNRRGLEVSPRKRAQECPLVVFSGDVSREPSRDL